MDGNLIECSICLNNIQANDNIIILNCEHSYHKNCLEQWFKKVKLVLYVE